jgi:hypothetical protein
MRSHSTMVVSGTPKNKLKRTEKSGSQIVKFAQPGNYSTSLLSISNAKD